MEDHQIPTTRLTDWQPETNIKLQRAFGKFVEEAGELLDAIEDFNSLPSTENKISLENELADVTFTIEIITTASEGLLVSFDKDLLETFEPTADTKRPHLDILFTLVGGLGKALNIVGRCQIQGLSKSDPNTRGSNILAIEQHTASLQGYILYAIKNMGLDKERILKRSQDKIDSKLPWVMGTATDLLPDADHPLAAQRRHAVRSMEIVSAAKDVLGTDASTTQHWRKLGHSSLYGTSDIPFKDSENKE